MFVLPRGVAENGFWVIWSCGMYAVASFGVFGKTAKEATAGKMAKAVEDKEYSCEKQG